MYIGHLEEEPMKDFLSKLAAGSRGNFPTRASAPAVTEPEVAQPFSAAQIQLVLHLKELGLAAQSQAALQLDAWTKAGAFSVAQQSAVSGLLSLEQDDLMRTLYDCAAGDEARRFVYEELLRNTVVSHGK
jgi:hypothetical protein